MGQSTTLTSSTGLELPNLIGDAYASATFAAGTPGPFTLIPAVAGKSFLVTRLFIQADLASTQGTGGNIYVAFEHMDTDGTTVIQQIGEASFYVPQNSPAITAVTLGPLASSGAGYWYRSLKQGTSVRVRVSSGGPLTTGFIRAAINFAYDTLAS